MNSAKQAVVSNIWNIFVLIPYAWRNNIAPVFWRKSVVVSLTLTNLLQLYSFTWLSRCIGFFCHSYINKIIHKYTESHPFFYFPNEQYSNSTTKNQTKHKLLPIPVIDDQQANGSNKQGLTPSPSSTLQSSNTNVDSANGLKFLTVPGQNTQSSFSSGKKNTKRCRNKKKPLVVVHVILFCFDFTGARVCQVLFANLFDF